MGDIHFEPYTGQSKLRFWCQKVLPLVYDESLSYYELLGKVVDYLNNTISDVSSCEDNIVALRDAFIQLQNYVNEMFDDFAPEIERIIDEMIDSGEFGEILTGVVNGLIADEYSTTKGYAQFDYVIKDGKLYCSTASTSGEWDATKWRETTVGTDMQLLNQRVYNLNAGQVAFNESTTYGNGTVGKKLKDLDDFDDNLNAGQVEYNSEGTYNNATVGKELQELKGSLNSITPLDTAPTINSAKGVTSGGVKAALNTVQSEVEQALQNDLSGFVTTWLQNNFNPTTELPLDESLSIHGSAADAMATGNAVNGTNDTLDFIVEHTVNLFDPRNIIYGWFTNNNTINTENLRKDAIAYIPCKPSTTYYVKKGFADRFQIATTTAKPYVGISVENKWGGNASTETTYTTNANAVYLCVWFWDDYQNKSTLEDAIDNLLICESSTAKSYTQPFSAIDLVARNALSTGLTNALKRMPDLTNGQDLNDLSEAGWYFGTYSHTYLHKPEIAMATRSVCFIVVFPETYIGSNTYRNQWFFGISEGIMSFRTFASSTGWQPWKTYVSPKCYRQFVSNRYGIAVNSTKNSGTTLKIASWNVAHFNYDTDTLIGNEGERYLLAQKKLMNEINVDILFIQEDGEYLDNAHTYSTLNYFYKPYYPYRYGNSIRNPIYSKFPLTFLEEYTFPSGRTATFCSTTVNNKVCLLVNYHAVVDATTQVTEWAELISHIKTYTYDYLVMGGDWNTETQEQLDRVANTCATEGWTMCNGGYLGYICTWFENKPNRSGGALEPEAIDHIVVSNNIIPNNIKVYQDMAYYIYSDHVPITSELTFTVD